MSGRMPAASVTLTCEAGSLVAHGVELDTFDAARDELVARAERKGWSGPFTVAPAPGRPDGVVVSDRRRVTTWAGVDEAWEGRRVRVRWESPGLSAQSDAPEWMRTQRAHMLVGVVFADGPAWSLRLESGAVVSLTIPGNANVCEAR